LLALIGFGLSTNIFAADMISDTVTGTENAVGDVVTLGHWHHNNWADYLLTDKDTGEHTLLDGVSDGVSAPTDSLRYNYSDTIGDTLTDLRTNRTGVITGVKEQGTMDVMGHHGKVTRYQYVIFKVKKH
jgi:hypothetical protein